MKLAGPFGRNRRGIVAAAALAVLAGALWLADRLLPPDLTRFHDRSTVMLDARGEILRAYLTRDEKWRLALGPDRVDPRYLAMLTNYEDRRFRAHPGVDPLALLRAAGQAAWHGRIVSGGSTITMQAARLLEPRPRTLTAKLIEIARAVQLTWRFDKDEILAIYMTLVPMGGNLEGVRAASLAYFGKEPAELTDGEAALLVALPQSPARTRPDSAQSAAEPARAKVLGRMVAEGLLDETRAREANEERLPSHRLAMPMLAPHLTDRLRARGGAVETIATHVDAIMQRTLEELARREAARLEDGGDVAVIVVENAGRRVRAYIGGSNYFRPATGHVDLAQASRSPGSTLKPFIYGMAFDELIIHPESLVDDRPMSFGDYTPQNFDRMFRGALTAREALQRSLNIPAIALLERLGPMRFATSLGQAGARLQFERRESLPSLSVGLGGVGMSLADLAMLYAGLADQGRMRALSYATGEEPRAYQRLLGDSAAWYVAEALRGAARPDGIAAGTTRTAVAYKTGTSYGFRDAWAVGYTASHTVGVWVGRPEGTPRPGAIGRSAAAPLLFKTIDLIPGTVGIDRLPIPAEAIRVANAELPPALRRFERGQFGSRDPNMVRIAYPRDGTAVGLKSADGRMNSLVLEAEGGVAPLAWLVNGVPVPPAALGAPTIWQPDQSGFARVVVVDSAGRSASVEVKVE